MLESGADIATWTVTGMLNELQVDHLPPGGVLVVDEAGMIGDRELAELVSLAAQDNAKLVVVGDPSQLQPIGAGAPMRTLGEHIGRVLVTENVRQKEPWERAALQLVRDGEARAAYSCIWATAASTSPSQCPSGAPRWSPSMRGSRTGASTR